MKIIIEFTNLPQTKQQCDCIYMESAIAMFDRWLVEIISVKFVAILAQSCLPKITVAFIVVLMFLVILWCLYPQ